MSKKSKSASKKDGLKLGPKSDQDKSAKDKTDKTGKKSKQSASSAAPASGAGNILRASDIGARQETFVHPWNPNSEIIGVQLAKRAGLERLGVSIARIPPGKESFLPHAHQCEEEWIYVLMGQAKALIGDSEHDIGAGDFVAYPAPQAPHHLRNVGGDDFVYLMGGEIAKFDIVDFPTVGKRTIRNGDDTTIYASGDGQPLAPTKKRKSK